MNSLLLIIFIIHLGVFTRLFFRKKQVVYAMFAIVFICLIASVLVGNYVPEWQVSGVKVYTLLRNAAVVLSFISSGVWLGKAIKARRHLSGFRREE